MKKVVSCHNTFVSHVLRRVCSLMEVHYSHMMFITSANELSTFDFVFSYYIYIYIYIYIKYRTIHSSEVPGLRTQRMKLVSFSYCLLIALHVEFQFKHFFPFPIWHFNKIGW